MGGGVAHAQDGGDELTFEPDDHSLRIGTLNASLKAPASHFNFPWEHPKYDSAAIRDGARDIADRIIQSGYDVIVLNEVWWGEAEEILRDELRSVYPFFVQEISNDGLEEGSGLNVFSKFPFQPVSAGLTEFRSHDFLIELNEEAHECPDESGACSDFFAFLEFSENSGSEVWADKGVGYVRVRNPGTNRIHNVFFTHMQATYADEHDPQSNTWPGFAERTSQFDEIRQFMLAAQLAPNAITWGDRCTGWNTLMYDLVLRRRRVQATSIGEPWTTELYSHTLGSSLDGWSP